MSRKKLFEPLFPLDRYKDSLKPFTISSTRFFVKPSTSANFYFQKSLLIEKCPSSKTCIRHQSLKRMTQQGKIFYVFSSTLPKTVKLESASLVNLSRKVYPLPKTISISAKESDIIYRQRGGAEDFDCVTMKFTDPPHKALKYSFDAPLLAVNRQSIFFSPSLYSVGDDGPPPPQFSLKSM